MDRRVAESRPTRSTHRPSSVNRAASADSNEASAVIGSSDHNSPAPVDDNSTSDCASGVIARSVIGNASAVGISSTSSPRCTLTLIVEAITVIESVAAAATARPDPKREICSNRFVSALRSGVGEAPTSGGSGDGSRCRPPGPSMTAATANSRGRSETGFDGGARTSPTVWTMTGPFRTSAAGSNVTDLRADRLQCDHTPHRGAGWASC